MLQNGDIGDSVILSLFIGIFCKESLSFAYCLVTQQLPSDRAYMGKIGQILIYLKNNIFLKKVPTLKYKVVYIVFHYFSGILKLNISVVYVKYDSACFKH